MVAKNLIDTVIALPLQERLELMNRIEESVRNDQAAEPLSEEHRRILDERLADLERNPDDWLPWEAVEARIRAKLEQP